MKAKDKIIFDIASKVRKACEKFSYSDKAKNYDFHLKKDLSCMCAVASTVLKEVLLRNSIQSKFVCGQFSEFEVEGLPRHGDDHCWVECGNKIIDITATQFGNFKSVWIVSKKHYFYIKAFECDFRYLKKVGWDKSQRPNKRVVSQILRMIE